MIFVNFAVFKQTNSAIVVEHLLILMNVHNVLPIIIII